MYTSSSTSSVVLQQKQNVQQPTHGPTHPPCIAAQQHVQQQYVITFTQRCCIVVVFLRCPTGTGPFDAPRMSSSALECTPVLQQKQHVQHPNHAKRPTMYSTAAGRTAAVRESFMRRLSCCIVLGFPCFPMFLQPPAISGTADSSFRCSPLVEFGGRTVADETLCRVGRVWYGRAAAGGRVALGRAVPKRGMLKQA